MTGHAQTDPLGWITDKYPPLITRRQAAQICGCDERTIDRRRDDGTLEALRRGRNILILRDSARRWLAAGLQQTG